MNFYIDLLRVFVNLVVHILCTVGQVGSVGIATRYGLDGPVSRSRWQSGLRRGPATARFFRLRVHIPPGTWMFVLFIAQCGQKAKARTTSTTKYR